MNKKKILFFIATEKGYRVLNTLILSGKREYIAAVVSFHEIGVQKDFFYDIKKTCVNNNILLFEWGTIKDKIIPLIQEYKITSCVAISWRYLLPLSVNKYLEDKLIIFHDSLLPKYRGFAPIVTAMINEEKKIGASVLFATEQADRGEIIMQETLEIDRGMHIQEVIEKMAEIYAKLACKLVDNIAFGTLVSTPQDDSQATYSIWRDEDDYWIDWTCTAEKIQCFVNAVGYPYRGAKTRIDGEVIRIIKCCVVDDIEFAIRTPGKIWLLNNNSPVVVCGTGLIRIDEALDEEGNVFVFKKLRCRMR